MGVHFLSMAVAWVWLYAHLCIGIQNYNCVSPIFTPENSIVKTLTMSKFQCTASVPHFQATGFSYQGRECVLKGLGMGNFSQTNGKSQVLCTLEPPAEDLEEIARQKTTYASPQYQAFVKTNAVDNDLTTMYHSDGGTVKPWWVVEFGDVRKIYKVLVLPRDYADYRFNNIEIRGGTDLITDGDFSSWTLMAFYEGPYSVAQGLLTLNVNGIEARYISIQIIDLLDHVLQIFDVQVMAIKTSK